MMLKKNKTSFILAQGCLLFLLLQSFSTFSNEPIKTDSVKSVYNSEQKILFKNYSFKPISLRIAAPLFISYGFATINNSLLRNLDHSLQNELLEDYPHFNHPVDDYLQYTPAVAVYGLNMIGIKGKNNFHDRSVYFAMAIAIEFISVNSTKYISHIQRPDLGDHHAFPSGHTATAFMCAEFLRQEYKDVSPWIPAVGYAAATATGVLRVYNNKHWISDVIAGAGFGVLSTECAYFIRDKMRQKHLRKKMHRAE